MNQFDAFTLKNLQEGKVQALETLFKSHFAELSRYALRILNNESESEEIVQDVFINLWEKREKLKIEQSIRAYMFASVRNRCINQIQSKYSKINKTELEKADLELTDIETDSNLSFQQLTDIVEFAIGKLPDKCRMVFSMSRQTGLSNKEIASQLNISEKTVENQMTIALRKINQYLEKYWYVLVLVFFEYFSKSFRG